jgi:hypothetical protein
LACLGRPVETKHQWQEAKSPSDRDLSVKRTAKKNPRLLTGGK